MENFDEVDPHFVERYKAAYRSLVDEKVTTPEDFYELVVHELHSAVEFNRNLELLVKNSKGDTSCSVRDSTGRSWDSEFAP